MKSLMLFCRVVLQELGTRCRTSTTNDEKTVVSRVEDEGLSFLTITLADFGRDFQNSLDQGSVAPSAFGGFHRRQGLPAFMQGFLEQVFDRCSGRLLDVPSADAIFAIRQFTLMWAKIEMPCSPSRDHAAFQKYVECEQDVKLADSRLSASLAEWFSTTAQFLWGPIFSDVDKAIYYGEVVPSHGPGSTADSLRGNKKWRQQVWTERLEAVFPHQEYLATSYSLALANLGDVRILEPGAEIPAKVITVPKTLKTPRIIAMEPTCMQYMQQAIAIPLTERIEADDRLSPFIGFTDQLPNRQMAMKGSQDGSLATLDLSEASDRVSNQHVRLLFCRHPWLNAAVDATRSRKADVPGFGVLRLAKFASMGSALCFPVEAMVFLTICFMGIERVLNRPISARDLRSLRGSVRVYGDDIIVPVDYVHSVVGMLETFGFRVGASKSFWTGKFRESCGGDYYNGEDCTVVRVRSTFPTQQKHALEIASTASLRNQLYLTGLWESARFLDTLLEKLIPWKIVEDTSPLLGRTSVCFPVDLTGCRWDPETHLPLVKGAVLKVVIPRSPLDDYAALLKCLTRRGGVVTSDVGHLERAGRPQSVDIKLRWKCPW